MLQKRKVKTLLVLTAFVLLGVAAAKAPFQKERNLKVLPKDISDKKLDSIMQFYNIALGVNCDFCHSAKKDLFPSPKNVGDTLDFASDENSMKENARDMMRMTIEINKNHFYFDKTIRPEYLNIVNCKTCHRGQPFPIIE